MLTASFASQIETNFGNYVMSMKTSCWLFNPEWTGIFGADEMKGFNTSRWRPHGQCATWEETFHTITEGYNKLAAINPDGPYRNWLYTKGSVLGSIMDEDDEEELVPQVSCTSVSR